MTFYVHDVTYEKGNRNKISTEIIRGTATLNVNRPITYLYKGVSDYTVTLPKGSPGQMKSVVLYNTDNSGSVFVQYETGFQNASYIDILALSTLGDSVLFTADGFGWHIVNSHILE